MLGHIVASEPLSVPIIPLRAFISRAYQVAVEPVSQVMIALLGKYLSKCQNTVCGLIGFASFCARASNTFHQCSFHFSILLRQSLSSLRLISGIKARRVILASPCKCTSIG